MKVSSICQVEDFRFTSPCKRRWISGPYAWTHRQMDVWSTDKPRSAMSSSKSRKLKQNRRYHRTQVTITCGSDFRFQNNGGRDDVIPSRYQNRSCNTSPTRIVEAFSGRDSHDMERVVTAIGSVGCRVERQLQCARDVRAVLWLFVTQSS